MSTRAVRATGTPGSAGADAGVLLAQAARAAARRRRRVWRTYVVFGGLLVAALVVAPLVGSTRLDPAAVLDRTRPFADNLDAQIFFIARLPRVIAAAIVGATLAIAGVVMQALLRNSKNKNLEAVVAHAQPNYSRPRAQLPISVSDRGGFGYDSGPNFFERLFGIPTQAPPPAAEYGQRRRIYR